MKGTIFRAEVFKLIKYLIHRYLALAVIVFHFKLVSIVLQKYKIYRLINRNR